MAIWWFVRHGESLAQVSTWEGADSETPLSPTGERQADALATRMVSWPIQRVVVSPFLRARQTAERAMSLHVKRDPALSPFQVLHDVRERHAGDWLPTFRQEAEQVRQLAIWDFQPPNGESVRDATLRALGALAALEGDHNTIVFAHGRVLSGVLTLIDARDPGQGVHAIENCIPQQRAIAPGVLRRLLDDLRRPAR